MADLREHAVAHHATVRLWPLRLTRDHRALPQPSVGWLPEYPRLHRLSSRDLLGDPTTSFTRGKAKGAQSDIEVGLRIMLNAGDGAEPLKAKEVAARRADCAW